MTQTVQWTDDKIEYLRQFYAEQSNDAIAAVVGISGQRLSSKAHYLGLHKSEAYIHALRAANLKDNSVPVGSYRVDQNGVLKVKISCARGHKNKRWRSVYEMVWSAANGPAPAGHVVLFKPGMSTNILDEITLDRLECITLSERMLRHTCNNYPRELQEILWLRGALTQAINRRTKDAKEY